MAIRVEGVERVVQRLQWISGSPVFTIETEIDGFWTADRGVKIVGLETAAAHGSYIKATRASGIKRSLQRLILDIRDQRRT